MTTTTSQRAAMPPTWHGVEDPDHLAPDHVLQRNRLADAARDANWGLVLKMLEKHRTLSPNQWRPAGLSLYSPLHQAAWHGAPVEVVQRLLDLGAWRTLRTAKGDNALDIARDKGHRHLVELLTPTRRRATTYP